MFKRLFKTTTTKLQITWPSREKFYTQPFWVESGVPYDWKLAPFMNYTTSSFMRMHLCSRTSRRNYISTMTMQQEMMWSRRIALQLRKRNMHSRCPTSWDGKHHIVRRKNLEYTSLIRLILNPPDHLRSSVFILQSEQFCLKLSHCNLQYDH